MRKYLSTLHQKPEHHQKRFALVVAGCFTLLIFAAWVDLRFGAKTIDAAPVAANESTISAESPLESLKASASEAWSLLSGQVGKAEQGLKSVDLQNNYNQVRNDALNNR